MFFTKRRSSGLIRINLYLAYNMQPHYLSGLTRFESARSISKNNRDPDLGLKGRKLAHRCG